MSNTLKALQLLKKENENLKDLLSHVYDMSCLDDMIDDGFKDRDDDEFLGHNLILKSQIDDALGLSDGDKSISLTVPNLTGHSHNDTAVTASHYYTRAKDMMTDGPIEFTNDNKPIKIRSN